MCAAFPSHSGCFAVESKPLVVLKGSKRPFSAAWVVFLSSAAIGSGLRGWKVLTASKAWSRILKLSMPVITTNVASCDVDCDAAQNLCHRFVELFGRGSD
ncbi:MAG TPA: hypothetical protein VGP63_30930 [Planctomycetaceae bacterium]|jgi:hypothetical protein|nr:hypothetical protein [Planctomycetaceae bacterium]